MNVVAIVAHGLNCHWLGPYGNEWISTPAFDQLACEAITFDRHFADELSNIAFAPSLPVTTIQSLAIANVRTAFVDDRKERKTDTRPWAKTFAVNPAQHSTPAEALIGRVETALNHLSDREPWLLWIETERLIPPWDFEFETYQQYVEESGGFIEERSTEDEQPIDEPPIGPIGARDDSLWHRLHNSFAASISSFDAELAFLLDLLRMRGLDKSAAWILTSTYGFPLAEHGIIGPHGSRLHEELVHLPLMIRLPEAREAMRRVFAFTQTQDLSPTILELFGLPVTGTSLLLHSSSHTAAGRDACRLSADRGDHLERGLRTSDWLYLEAAASGPARLYRKPDDVWEVNDLSLRYPDDCDQLQAILNQREDS